jgi:putative oxidoreductase
MKGMSISATMARRAPAVLSLLRIVSGLLFMVHGTMKMFNFPAREGAARAFDLMSRTGVAGVLEVFGGALIVVGLFTRPVAFVLSGQMAVAYFIAHLPRGFWPTLNGGEPAALFSFIFFYLAFAGGGPFSLDALRGRRGP